MGLDLILLTGDHPFRDEGRGVLLQDSFLLLDLLVHQRLGEHGLVHLVVAVASVTNLHMCFIISVKGLRSSLAVGSRAAALVP